MELKHDWNDKFSRENLFEVCTIFYCPIFKTINSCWLKESFFLYLLRSLIRTEVFMSFWIDLKRFLLFLLSLEVNIFKWKNVQSTFRLKIILKINKNQENLSISNFEDMKQFLSNCFCFYFCQDVQ